jgi:hypothetical protein
MGFIESITGRKAEAPVEALIYSGASVTEAMKGIVVPEEKNNFKTTELGEDHPFDFTIAEGLYKKFGFLTGIIDKYVDFVVGPGYYFKVINESKGPNVDKAETIIADFLYHSDFETLLRAWLKEALIKGNGFMELAYSKKAISGMKVLNANKMFVKREVTGEVIEYNQYLGRQSKQESIKFTPDEIAHLKLNTIGDCAYGLGIVFPAMNTINNTIMCDTDMHMLMNRKANAPIHAKIGSLEHKRFPADSVVTSFGQKLEWLHNKHEWVTGPDIEMKVLDFGNIGEKFSYPLEYDMSMLSYTFQVPEVILGKGSVPEGLAKVQMEAFMMRIQSIQAEIEKILEKQIIKRVLLSNGLDLDIEMEWGQPNKDDRNSEVNLLSSLMGRFSGALNTMIEAKIVDVLGFDIDEYDKLKTKEEADKKAMNDIEVPEVEDNIEKEEDKEEMPKLPLKKKESFYTKESCHCDTCESVMIEDDYNLPIGEILDE